MRSPCQQECFWIGFGEVFGMVFWYNFDTLLYCSACPAGKDLGRDLESKFFKFGMILDCFFEWFGRSCWHDFVIPLYIILYRLANGICVRDLWRYYNGLMDGSKSTTDMVVLFLNRIWSMRRRCQYFFAKPMFVKKNAKSMSRLMAEIF